MDSCQRSKQGKASSGVRSNQSETPRQSRPLTQANSASRASPQASETSAASRSSHSQVCRQASRPKLGIWSQSLITRLQNAVQVSPGGRISMQRGSNETVSIPHLVIQTRLKQVNRRTMGIRFTARVLPSCSGSQRLGGMDSHGFAASNLMRVSAPATATAMGQPGAMAVPAPEALWARVPAPLPRTLKSMTSSPTPTGSTTSRPVPTQLRLSRQTVCEISTKTGISDRPDAAPSFRRSSLRFRIRPRS